MLAAHDLPRASYEQPPPAFERALTVPDFTAELPLIDRLRRATIGRYDIYAELGAGGMATVFLALDLALDRKVAIKVMSPALISSPGAIDRFRREARVAAALSHPHIVPIHAIGGEPGLAYYVMKYIEGRSLDAVLRTEGQRDIAFAQAILGYVGSALHYAHQRGVVHRDVKPANIMLDREGWCYVTDFGIAKAEDSTGLTKSGVVIGTPNYMCPEQFNGQPITGAADQYALGVVAYELLTGEPPFGGPTLGEVMRGHLLEPVPAVRSRRPDIPEALEACVQRMMAKDPADRFPTVADAVAAFGTLSATVEGDARTVIAELARRGEGGPVIAVPTSPVPQHRSTVHADLISAHTRQMTHPGVTPAASTTGVHATPRRRTRAVPLLLAVGAVIAIGAAAWSATLGDATSGATSQQNAGDGSKVGAQGERSVATSTASPNNSPVGPAVDPAVGSGAGAAGDAAVGSRATPPAPPPTMAPAPSDAEPDRKIPPAADDNRQRPGKARDRLADIAARREAAGRPVAAAAVRIGSRIPSAWLYINDRPIRVIGERGVQLVPVPAGRVRLSIRKDNCQSWDTTFTAIAAERHVIGFRAPTC